MATSGDLSWPPVDTFSWPRTELLSNLIPETVGEFAQSINTQFEDLPGKGKPIPDLDKPLDENWWIRQKLRNEIASYLPPSLALKKEVESALGAALSANAEIKVRELIEQINAKITRANRLGIDGLFSASCPTTSNASYAIGENDELKNPDVLGVPHAPPLDCHDSTWEGDLPFVPLFVVAA